MKIWLRVDIPVNELIILAQCAPYFFEGNHGNRLVDEDKDQLFYQMVAFPVLVPGLL